MPGLLQINAHVSYLSHVALCSFYSPTLQGLLQRDKGPEVQSLDQLLKQKDVPDNKQEAFKIGFTEGFMRSQAYTQKSQGMCAIFSNTVASHRVWLRFLKFVDD